MAKFCTQLIFKFLGKIQYRPNAKCGDRKIGENKNAVKIASTGLGHRKRRILQALWVPQPSLECCRLHFTCRLVIVVLLYGCKVSVHFVPIISFIKNEHCEPGLVKVHFYLFSLTQIFFLSSPRYVFLSYNIYFCIL